MQVVNALVAQLGGAFAAGPIPQAEAAASWSRSRSLDEGTVLTLRIRHRTTYLYHAPVRLGPHRLMLRRAKAASCGWYRTRSR